MGIGPGPQNTIEFLVNPPVFFNDPLDHFPAFTRDSFELWIIDNSSSFDAGNLSNIVQFNGDWEIIGDDVLYNELINNLKIGPSGEPVGLGSILPDSIISIGENSFRGLGLSGPLDLTGLTELTQIGNSAFAFNNFDGTLTFGNLPDLSFIGSGAFDNNNFDGSLDLTGLTGLTQIGDSAFSNNSFTEILIPNNIDSSINIGSGVFPDLSGKPSDPSGYTWDDQGFIIGPSSGVLTFSVN